MRFVSQDQQKMFNARAASGDPKWIKLARDSNQATYGRPGWTKGGSPIHPHLKAAAQRRGQSRYAKLPKSSPGRPTRAAAPSKP